MHLALLIFAIILQGWTNAVVSGVNVTGCSQCDTLFTTKLDEYQRKYNTTAASARDSAKYHCDQFSLVQQCYAACHSGKDGGNTSAKEQTFRLFYLQTCDPVCTTAVLPWCYMKYVGVYELYKSCNNSTPAINEKLKQCLVDELYVKQTCNGTCTAGQRKAAFLFMQLHAQCTIPKNDTDYCFDNVQYCIESNYGDAGADFIAYSDVSLANDNNQSCQLYRRSFEECLEQLVYSNVTLGFAPSMTTYYQPCLRHRIDIDSVKGIEQSLVTKDICGSSAASFRSLCSSTTTVQSAQLSVTSVGSFTAKMVTPIATSTLRPSFAASSFPSVIVLLLCWLTSNIFS